MSEHESNSEFLGQLRNILLDVSHKQLDGLVRLVSNLSDKQAEVVANEVGRAMEKQSEAIGEIGQLLIERLAALERQVAALHRAGYGQ
jgi:hypothetical protein